MTREVRFRIPSGRSASVGGSRPAVRNWLGCSSRQEEEGTPAVSRQSAPSGLTVQ
ncbi:hypothetical protein DAPPUDRAFT_247921 [Daphnia pulex]|uniref:Uncharacterized protein n=1 Tax=Daphnia pulex TaxID=6669 RepID=E9GT49_DAPPU|nr:hypothetical protein DAPPUDRAFT_247921 [Daphnia pulex]|eukprot:EFX77334.1 hypothetical protein DAPPUDRAFT_247921 [Daphnia pulex]